MHIKVIEQSQMLEGIVEIDEKEVRFRYFKDDSDPFGEVYIWNGIQWEDMDYDNPSHLNLSEVCSQFKTQ